MRWTRAAASWCAVSALAVALLVGGCGYDHSAEAQRKAQQLTSAAHAAGVGDNVTVRTAEALYGKSARAVCKLFRGSGTELKLPLNPGLRGFKVVTSKEVRYGRLVVQVYCPQRLDAYNRVVAGLHVSRSTS